ncbi:MAG: heme A synthase [Pelagibacteraceae bacterium TMED124]|nr:MAG: heme A synthase [Pelagibacteraceae bacterium TMED124]|tara:strand:+ start:1715 stop:2743 length:1029 start_codon:yes stop_codon:yes gene_type:complete
MEILLRKEFLNLVYYWLLSILILIGLIVIVGGLTRLTDSGLSITRWDVVSGIFPPFSEKAWDEAFNLYKKIPQFYLSNPDLTISEFKVIYYWEYFHRILGRILGLAFIIPLLFFYYKKVFSREYNIKFLLLFLLILIQGTVGWYMVKSGLIENTTVSHYRLAIHLNLALILFSATFWYLLNLKNTQSIIFFNFSKNNIYLKIFILLIFLQITFGAFTSGLDAGMLYQTWPLMNQNYFPDDISFNNNLFDLFNQPSFVQFIHRNLAYLIVLYTLIILFFVLYKRRTDLYKSAFLLVSIIFVQAFLGILTLLSGVNIVFASMHQLSTIFLLLFSIYFYYKSLNQ